MLRMKSPLSRSAGLIGFLTIALALFARSGSAADVQQINLVASTTGTAPIVDTKLKNAWGAAFSPQGPIWVAANGSGVSTVYDNDGNPFPANNPLVVTIPVPSGHDSPSAPTGMVFNTTKAFIVAEGSNAGSAFFIFVTEDGTISGWNPTVNATNAVIEVDNSANEAIYKGAALFKQGNKSFLYVTNFHAGTVEAYDSSFKPVQLVGNFTDPNLPAGFAPFNIAVVNKNVYVSYAKQDADKEDDVKGAGFGYISVFKTNGTFVKRFASEGSLNAPWGMVPAKKFGRFKNVLLVGNFGDGQIHAFSTKNGADLGALTDLNGNIVAIDGLWALFFRLGESSLFFTAGPNDEEDGLLGKLQPLSTKK
jgi:uncharacterized protein (TIGR03118 family)